jgi:antitoxin component YwqK of YwqJK toxin-antitoxin module
MIKKKMKKMNMMTNAKKWQMMMPGTSLKQVLLSIFVLSFFRILAQDTTFTNMDPSSGLQAYSTTNKDMSLEQGYLLKGKKQGMIRTFFPNGVLQTAAEYQNGQRDGWYLECEKNGVVLKEEHYVAGKLEGEVRTYFTSKSVRIVKSVYHYKDGVFHGTCSDYNEMGKLSSMATYQMGVKDGVSRWYFTNGLLAMEQQYKNGLLDGEQTSYFADGKVSSNGFFKENKKTGLWKEYHANGVLKATGEYADDVKKSGWLYYDESGNLSDDKMQ